MKIVEHFVSMAFVGILAGAPAVEAQSPATRERLHEYCATTRGQSCYDEGIIGRDGQFPLKIPAYDVEAACRRGGLGVRVCVEAEQSDYDAAKRTWPNISDRAKQGCIASFRTEGPRRYASFVGCVYARALEEQQSGERLRSPPAFRY